MEIFAQIWDELDDLFAAVLALGGALAHRWKLARGRRHALAPSRTDRP